MKKTIEDKIIENKKPCEREEDFTYWKEKINVFESDRAEELYEHCKEQIWVYAGTIYH